MIWKIKSSKMFEMCPKKQIRNMVPHFSCSPCWKHHRGCPVGSWWRYFGFVGRVEWLVPYFRIDEIIRRGISSGRAHMGGSHSYVSARGQGYLPYPLPTLGLKKRMNLTFDTTAMWERKFNPFRLKFM